MLQAPSQLSRVCGHGHIKKFWLMQTQNESQACENASNSLSSASSRPVPFTSFKSSDGGKHAGAQWSRPLSTGPAAAAGGSAYGGSLNGSRHASLLTCAESLTDQHALRPQLASSFMPDDIKSQFDRHGNEDGELLPATSPAEDVDLLASSSRCDFDPALPAKFHHVSAPNYRSDSSTETDEDVSSACVGDRISPLGDRNDVSIGEQAARYKSGDDAEALPQCGTAAGNFALSPRSVHDAEALNKGFGYRSHERIAVERAVVRSLDMRTCSLCGTSKTPLWRSGPKGPKSLCNACGIRYKKSRRLASQVEGSESSHLAKPLGRPLKRKQHPLFTYRSSLKHSLSAKLVEAASLYKKKPKWPKLILQDHGEFNLDNISAKVGQSKKLFAFSSKSGMKESSRGIGKDEEEAAVLLMYLSCGLVCA